MRMRKTNVDQERKLGRDTLKTVKYEHLAILQVIVLITPHVLLSTQPPLFQSGRDYYHNTR